MGPCTAAACPAHSSDLGGVRVVRHRRPESPVYRRIKVDGDAIGRCGRAEPVHVAAAAAAPCVMHARRHGMCSRGMGTPEHAAEHAQRSKAACYALIG